MYVSEVLLTKEDYTAADWQNLVKVITKHTGGIQPLELIVGFQDKNIRFFIESKKDISNLSSGIEGFMLRSSELPDEFITPKDANKLRFLNVPTGGNVIDVRERYHVQENKQLIILRIKVRRLGERMASTMIAVMAIGSTKYVVKQYLALFPAHLFAINLLQTQNYIFASTPTYVSLEKTLHLLQTQDFKSVFSIPGFPYSNNDYYLPINSFQFDAHSLIVGASGSGKSRLIELLIDRIEDYGNAKETYRVVVIDPHAALEENLQYINNSRIINLGNESAQLFPDANADISAATELTTTLFKSLLKEQYNPRLERLLRFTVYVLLTAQIMTLDNLRIFLTDLDMRIKVLEHVQGFVPQNIQQFFATDFNELRTQHYNEAILPIVSLVDEMQLQPSLVGEAANSLAMTLQDNFLSVFSLNKVSMGEKAVKTVAGLLIQQIFLIAQARVLPYKIIMVIDEVSIVQNPALASILAEARKFNLTVIITQQYFSQVDIEIKDSILGNVANYYIFRVSEDDAEQLEGNIVIELPDEVLEKGRAKGQTETAIKIDLLTSLSPRECFVRVLSNGQLMPALKARTVDTDSMAKKIPKIDPIGATKLQKLPPKMMFDHASNLQAAQKSIAELEKVEVTPSLGVSLPEITPVDKDTLIPLQRILADQSSSRKDTRKVL